MKKNIQTIYSLRELHNLLENTEEKDKLMVFFDLDLTLVKPHPENEELDVLIEPELTKELFDYIRKHDIGFVFITARFYDTVCNQRKRDLKNIESNLFRTIFPLLEGHLEMDISEHKKEEIGDEFHIIKNEKDKCVGIIFRGVIFGDKKGEIIKHYKKKYGFDQTHPITIFVDDYEPYIKNVSKHVPEAIILRREIEEPEF